MRRRPVVLAAIAAMSAISALTVGACTDSEGPPGDRPGATTTSGPASPPTSAATETTIDPRFGTTQVSAPPETYGLLKAVRAASHDDDGFERVVFEFEGDIPGYRVGYTDRPVQQDGSGDEVRVDGAAVLLVHFEPSSTVDLSGDSETPREVYRGPKRLDLATTTIIDVVFVSDFEANLEWAVGLDAKVPFRVTTLTEPGRIVLDVRRAA